MTDEMSVEYLPKGGLCITCVHWDDDCSHLDFQNMRVIAEDDDRKFVKCIVFIKKENEDPCRDHEWISIKNEVIQSGEMCLTCYQNGEARVPIRREQS